MFLNQCAWTNPLYRNNYQTHAKEEYFAILENHGDLREKMLFTPTYARTFCFPSADQGPVSRTSRELFGPEKLVVKLQSARFEKLNFLHAFNMRKIKRIAKFEGLESRRCEDIKGIVIPDIGPKSFGTFEKQAPGLNSVTGSTQFRLPDLTRWSGDVIRRTGMKNFNAVSHNRARPYFRIQHGRGEVRACRVNLNVHPVTGNVVDTEWPVEFWRWKCCREFGNNT